MGKHGGGAEPKLSTQSLDSSGAKLVSSRLMNDKAAIAELLATGQGSPSQLREIWQLRGMRSIVENSATAGAARDSAGAWLEDASVAALFVRRALEIGEYFLACDAAREALRLHGPSTGSGQQDRARIIIRYRRSSASAYARRLLRHRHRPARRFRLPLTNHLGKHHA